MMERAADYKVLLEGTAVVAVAREVDFFHQHPHRMAYRAAQRVVEPIDSSPVEATSRPTKCRFQRPSQFCRPTVDKAMLRLEMFWRNRRWYLRVTDTDKLFDPARNSMRALTAPQSRWRLVAILPPTP
jgi:hypothetical protein